MCCTSKSGVDKLVLPDKVLFLDFDGVCNSFKEGSYLTHGPEEYGFGPENVKRIREICEKTGAGIVISSNWRRYGNDECWIFDGKKYKNPLPGLMKVLGDLVCGTLPRDRYIRKSEAVTLWFEDTGFKGKFAILDDDPKEGFQNDFRLRKSFWQTNGRYGVTERIKDEVVDHLLAP